MSLNGYVHSKKKALILPEKWQSVSVPPEPQTRPQRCTFIPLSAPLSFIAALHLSVSISEAQLAFLPRCSKVFPTHSLF